MALKTVLVVTAMVGFCYGAMLSDEQFYEMPNLFHLDDYKACLSQKTGLYCLGSFELRPVAGGEELFRMMQEYSSDINNFNHTRLHRGYCVSERCPDWEQSATGFVHCLDSRMQAQYGLQASLLSLDYCHSGRDKWQGPDRLQLAVAVIVTGLVILNLAATVYHVWHGADSKANNYILAWSLKSSWARLTARYDEGDKRLSALNPIQGVKTISLLLITMGHTGLFYNLGYIHNTLFLERISEVPYAFMFLNGTGIVHVFVMLTSFLLAYNMLIIVDNNPKIQLNLSMLPLLMLQRIIRVVPVYLFVLGLMSTWWAYIGDGAMWQPLIGAEAVRCRCNWWTNILFINNFVGIDNLCLLQTWSMAIDLQLYLFSSIVILILGRWPRTALKITGYLFISSVLGLAVMSYFYGFKSHLFYSKPEVNRVLYKDVPSFKWLYIAPWGFLPASMLGLFLAFLHYDLEKTGVKIREYKVIRIAYRFSGSGMFIWSFIGYLCKDVSSPVTVLIVTSFDRPVHLLVSAIGFLGLFHKVGPLWKFLSWQGFQILGRMSVSALLLHWIHIMSIIGSRYNILDLSSATFFSDALVTFVLTYLTALPVTLFVQIPSQRFLQTLFFRSK